VGTLLPIDALLPEVVAALRQQPALVLEAPPGAGKTTRVPRALLEARPGAGEVVVLEPRRLAARLAARRVAEELGEPLGERVGYQVRWDSVASARTRLRYVTQGVLLRRLLGDPHLHGVTALVLDEFHERQIEGDLVLALARRLARGPRPDLWLVVMSATLDGAPVAAFLGGAPRLRSEGQRFEVTIEHLDRPDERPLPTQVAHAVGRLVREGLDGHVLVFLPGVAEIRRAGAALGELAARAGLAVRPLYGDLPADEQDRALAPSERRKVILATNVAETALTIDGVVAVIDSGLARLASHAPWSGLPLLRVGKVSRASAAQRAGRAGRTRPGRCLRLYTRHDHDSRPEHELPELRRLDLSETVLALRAAGVVDLAAFEWLDPPPPAALEQAETLLLRLGALDPCGAPTELGRRMLRLPLHPRLARIVCEAQARGVLAEGCAAAALLGERVRRAPRAGAVGPSDVAFDLEALAAADRGDPRAQAIRRAQRQLVELCRATPAPPPRDPDQALLVSLLAGYPDRVARRRAPRSDEVLLAGGGAARLSPESVVLEAELLVAIDAEERRQPGRGGAEAIVHTASAVEPEWLADLFPEALVERDELLFNEASGRVEAVRTLRYQELVLEERRGPPRPAEEEAAAQLLAEAALRRPGGVFDDPEAVVRLQERLFFAASLAPDAGLAAPDGAELRAAALELCRGRHSLDELAKSSLAEALLGRLGARRARLERLAPERVTLPGGRQVRVHYQAGQTPSIASRLQDFFGAREGPRIGEGRVALTLHLLAPNQRAVQVTTDLAGFWTRHYPQIRRELARRYPRHAWPEDPLAATPPAPSPRRRP
jgi:ATP-dependent helicase HrpB